jgi:NAD-dependent deacetylase
MKKLVVLSGAGISADSGLRTFRDSGGLWEGYDVRDVASIEGWKANPALVLEFYNKRFFQAKEALPNKAHLVLAELETYFDVTIITQNVDDLHEKAGSTKVLHLHGKLNECKSERYNNLIYPYPENGLKLGDFCEKGYQLRPNVVWFGEPVPMYEKALLYASNADIFLVIGTSLQVYPAAGLIYEVPFNAKKFLLDKKKPEIELCNFTFIEGSAAETIEIFKHEVMRFR